MKLTSLQTQYLKAIIEFVSIKGYPPTQRECAGLVGHTYTYGRCPIYALERKGYMRIDPYVQRGLVVIKNELGQPVRFGYEVVD